MKKTLLLLLFAATISVTQAQTIYKSIGISEGTISARTGQWVYGTTYDCNISFRFQNRVIVADDEAGSVYHTGKQLYKENTREFSQIGWEAIDEKNRSCTVKIIFYKDGSNPQFYVFYDTLSLCYTLKKNTEVP